MTLRTTGTPRFAVRPTAAAAAGYVAIAIAASAAHAQQAPAGSSPGAQPSNLGTVTVTGIRRAIEDSINVKRQSDSIVEAVSAEDIGKLPDTSIAESVARLPGIAAQRTAGRASQISIRGFAPDFAATTLNGREQVTTGDSRGVEFDQYPSELLSSVVVYKTPDAGLIGQGLSATVDLQTIRPLRAPGRGFAVNYREQRSGVGLPGDQGKGSRFSISYIDQFADRTIGVALGFARLDETTAQTQRFEAWGVAEGPYLGQTVKAPGGFNAWVDQTKQTRDGATAVLQFKPNANFESTLDVFMGRFDKNKSTKGFQAPIGFSSAGGYDPNGDPQPGGTVANGVLTAGSFNNFKGVVRNDAEVTKDELDSFGWNNRFKFGGWTGVVDLSRSTAKRTGTIIETTAGLPGNTPAGSLGTISWTGFDGSNVGGARYTTSLNYADRNVISLTDVMGWGGGTATPQAGYSKLPNVKDELNALRLSGKTDLPDGWFFAAGEFGLNVTDRTKDRAYVEGRLTIGSTPYATAAIPAGGTIIAGQSGIPIVTFDPAGTIGSIYTVAPKLVRDIANKDWTVSEKVTTAYGKFDIDRQLFGLSVRGNAGVQVQHTDQSSRAFNVDGGPCPGDVCTVTNNRDGITYTDILPSLNLATDLGNGNTVRFGLARVLARPTINDMRASLGFGVDNTLGVLKGDAGNPRLEPFRANQVDLAWEKYFAGNKGYVAAAAFYKDLSTYIVKQDVVTDFTPYITTTTPLPPGGRVLGLLNKPVNGSGGTVNGVELAASLPFSMVSSWLNGFGLQASYAHTSSSVKVPSSGINGDNIGSSSIPLPGLSKDVAGLTLYYERAGFGARVATRYRSDFIGEVTDIVGDRRLTWVKSEAVTDLQLSYEIQSGFAKGLSVIFQANNIGDAEFVRYRDTPSNEIERTKYGRTYLFGLNYKL